MATLEQVLSHTQRPYLPRARAHPFLKWAGGKRAVVPDIAQRLPESLGTYWEPFLGGGAVFFALDSQCDQAQLSDINEELMLTYKVVRDHAEPLIAALTVHAEQHEQPAYYLHVRNQRTLKGPIDVAARFIYLNRTCFNGLYRVNKDGWFNVPKGRYKNPTICDAAGIRAASVALQSAGVRFGPFDAITPAAGDFVYCDPPYDGASVAYDSHPFGDAEQKALRDATQRWADGGAHVMISNADTPLIRSLYGSGPYTLHPVSAPRNISCDGAGRGKVAELLITTYVP